MRRILTILGVALIGYAMLPTFAHAQVVVQIGRPYQPSFIVAQPIRPVYYVAPPVTYYPPATTYSYYPPTTVYSYPPPVVSYSPPPVVTYSPPPATFVTPGGVETRTYYGYGILRPRGYYSESYYRPLP